MPIPAQIHLDLETLGVKHTSQILSIGAVHGTDIFYREIDAYQYNPDDFTMCDSTIKWWTARGGFIPSQDLESPANAIAQFAGWVADITDSDPDTEIWANSPTFDCAILRYHMSKLHISCPWNFWQERDVRTIKNAAKALGIPLRGAPNPHNALKDARNQAELVHSFYFTVGESVGLIRDLKLQGKLNEQEIRVELHGTDGI